MVNIKFDRSGHADDGIPPEPLAYRQYCVQLRDGVIDVSELGGEYHTFL